MNLFINNLYNYLALSAPTIINNVQVLNERINTREQLHQHFRQTNYNQSIHQISTSDTNPILTILNSAQRPDYPLSLKTGLKNLVNSNSDNNKEYAFHNFNAFQHFNPAMMKEYVNEPLIQNIPTLIDIITTFQ